MRFNKLLIIFAIFLGIFLFLGDDLLDIYSELSLQLPQFEKEIGDFLIKETEKQILTPQPLRAQRENPEALLTQKGIIKWTNIQREKYGFSPLIENEKLNASAELKVEDMFEKQYFAHSSPLGVGVGDLLGNVGYEFIVIGENLALGDFQTDEVLVQAWMDSLGHRENILNTRYQEIGVAAVKGMFEGKSTWLAIQHFGVPLSTCSQPDETLEAEIKLKQNQIEELHKTLITLQGKIKNTKPKRGSFYKEMVDKYNTLISQYNILVNETEVLINQYNNQVILFNECVVGVE